MHSPARRKSSAQSSRDHSLRLEFEQRSTGLKQKLAEVFAGSAPFSFGNIAWRWNRCAAHLLRQAVGFISRKIRSLSVDLHGQVYGALRHSKVGKGRLAHCLVTDYGRELRREINKSLVVPLLGKPRTKTQPA